MGHGLGVAWAVAGEKTHVEMAIQRFGTGIPQGLTTGSHPTQLRV